MFNAFIVFTLLIIIPSRQIDDFFQLVKFDMVFNGTLMDKPGALCSLPEWRAIPAPPAIR